MDDNLKPTICSDDGIALLEPVRAPYSPPAVLWVEQLDHAVRMACVKVDIACTGFPPRS